MTVSETYTAIGDAIRRQYGTTDKYSLGDMPKMIDNLQVTNILDDNQFYDTSKDKGNKTITGLDLAKINSLAGKTIVISFDVEWDGFEYTDGYNRSGIEWDIIYKNHPQLWMGVWLMPEKMTSGKKHVSATFTLPDDEATGVFEGSYFNQVKVKSLKATNIKIIVDPLGGVVPPNLFDIARMKLTNANRDGTLFTFEDNSNPNGSVYTDFLVQNNIPLKKNTAYQLSFSVRGTGTIVTYVYGNNSSGKYVDNGHRWGLTNQWQEFQQYLPPESVPLNANFNFRSATNCSGEVTNLKLTPVE